jgi:hypothetical protein
MRPLRPTTAPLLLVGLAALSAVLGTAECAGRVRTQKGPTARLSGYHTYAWMPAPEGTAEERFERSVTGARIHLAVDRGLTDKGLKIAQAGQAPDLLIAYRISESDALSSDWGYGPGPYLGAADIYTFSSQGAGALLLDVIEACSHHVVWRGAAAHVVDQPDTANPRVEPVIRRMLAHYPSTRGG